VPDRHRALRVGRGGICARTPALPKFTKRPNSPSAGGRLPVALDSYRLSAFDPTLRPIDFLKSHFVSR
jgi:hypothetical protein